MSDKPVPGPHLGPGLVFADIAEQFGAAEGAAALDADTGAMLEVPEEARVIGEYQGTVLTVDDAQLAAAEPTDSGELATRWQVSLEEYGWVSQEVAATAGTDPGAGLALLDVGTGESVLLDLANGDVLAEGVRDADTDPATGSRVLLGEDGLRGLDPNGSAQWSAPAGEDAEIRSIGGALVYLVDGGSVRVLNVLTGDVAAGYDSAATGVIAVPELIAPTGTALLTAGEETLLATSLPADGRSE